MSKSIEKTNVESEIATNRRKLLAKLGKYSVYTAPVLLSSFTAAKAVNGVSA
jgi:hypothetical protein